MTLQNRVNPFGNIIATPERGTCMGNRGILHDERQQVTHYHRHKNWIICVLNRNNEQGRPIKRKLMQPGRYTELFFLDEATALAAGHRPCAECSRPRYTEFVRLWRLANPTETGKIDDRLHRDRFIPYRTNWPAKKRTFTAPVEALPFGTFITLAGDPQQPYLVLEDSLHPWTFGGYGSPIERPAGIEVTVLTPVSTMRTLAAGYRPAVWPERY